MNFSFRRSKHDRPEQSWIMHLLRPEAARTSPALFTYHLREKLGEKGCPLCRMVRESEEHWGWTLLYEFTGDPEIHERFAKAGGLCAEHGELIRRIVESRQLVTPSGVARLYETVTKEFLHRPSAQHPEARDCPLCRYRRQAEERYTYFLADTLAEPDWQELFTRSDGLCMSHFELVMKHANREAAEFIQNDQSRRLRELLHLLQELQRKQRYDVPEPLTPEESASWHEALWRFGGMHFDHLLVHD